MILKKKKVKPSKIAKIIQYMYIIYYKILRKIGGILIYYNKPLLKKYQMMQLLKKRKGVKKIWQK